MPNRVFLLSPASCSGRRAQVLLRPDAQFDLARRLRDPGVPLGEAFSFLSGLYFRGKLAYASRFAVASVPVPRALVITAGRGLLPPDTIVTDRDLRAFDQVTIDLGEPRYRQSLERDAVRLVRQLDADSQVVLLGSIATPKYRDVLLDVFGPSLHYPPAFIGRGDMSRGGLMLRSVDENRELDYLPLAGAHVRGPRPAKLEPRSRVRRDL